MRALRDGSLLSAFGPSLRLTTSIFFWVLDGFVAPEMQQYQKIDESALRIFIVIFGPCIG